MKRHSRDLEVMSDLNLTNMIDTAFVLLITFILVAPAMKSGLDLDLPKVDGTAKPTDVANTLTISIRKAQGAGMSENIFIEDRMLTLEQMQAEVQTRRMANPKLDIVIEADRQSTYDTFAQVMGVLQALNVENVGLITDPSDSGGDAKDDKKPQTGN